MWDKAKLAKCCHKAHKTCVAITITIKHVATIDLTKFWLCLRFAPLVLSLADSGNLTELWSMELSSTLMKSWERLRRWSSVTNGWKLDYHTTLFITNCKEKIVIKFGTQGPKKQRALQWRVFTLKKLKSRYSQEHQTVTSIIESIKEKAIMAVNWVWLSLKGANNGIILETANAFSWKRITFFLQMKASVDREAFVC